VLVDPVDHLGESVREPRRRRFPGADGVPPVALGVPAGVDAEVVRPDLGRGVDQRQQLLGRRVTPQRVHVVVEDDRHPVLDRAPLPDRAALTRERREHAVDVGPDDERHRHRRERLVGGDLDAPLVLMVGRSAQQQVATASGLTELVVPWAVVLDLPAQGVRHTPVDQNADGQRFSRGPRVRTGHRVPAVGDVVVRVADDVCQHVPEYALRPPVLRHPAVGGGVQLGVDRREADHEGRQAGEFQRARPDDRGFGPGAYAGSRFEDAGDAQTRGRLLLDDAQRGLGLVVPGVPQLPPEDGAGMTIAGMTVPHGGDLHQGLARTRLATPRL